MMQPSRLQAEAAIRKELRVAISHELSFLSHADRLLRDLSAEVETAGEEANFQAIARLFSRSAGDIRGMYLLLERGYGLQALSLAASVYEHLITTAFIGCSEDHGRQWQTHNDPFNTMSPNMMAPMIQQRTTYNFVKVKKSNGKFIDAVYAMLCSAKHGNPLILSLSGVVSTIDGYYLNSSPFYSPEILRQAKLSGYGVACGLVQSLQVLMNEEVIREPTNRHAVTTIELAKQSIVRFEE
jgi:hypothetical protein